MIRRIVTVLTVYFENPFWVGVFERIEDGKLSACKLTFGAEPKDCEVSEFVIRHYYELKFGPALQADCKRTADNPKRRQRNIKKQMRSSGVGTKSQLALAARREESKIERRQIDRTMKEAEKQRRFELKREKRREKHRGR